MSPDGGAGPGRGRFYQVITDAVRDIEEHGFDGQWRVDMWLQRIRDAALASMTPPDVLERTLRETLTTIYTRQVDKGGILKTHPTVSRFTLDRVKPHLRAELDRRILASAGLIKMNRQASVEKTLQRFSGWSTSIPAGGSRVVDRLDVKTDIRKALAQLPFEERRVAIDQGAKLASSLSNILAVNNGAIAGIWHSHYRQAGYAARPDHREMDGKVYALRGNWAIERGLMTKCDGYTDEVDPPGGPVFCRCFYQWIYALRALPNDFVTVKGANELERIRTAA
jgi:hypothetical protein